MKKLKGAWIFRIILIVLLILSFLYFCLQKEQVIEYDESAITVEYDNDKKSVQQVIPGGIMTGIYAETQGVLVLGTGNIATEQGEVSSPAEEIVKQGDYILSCNGIALDGKEQLVSMVEGCNGATVYLVLLRGEKEIEVKLEPVLADDSYRLGIWVRDDIAGIGMLTFVTPDLEFVALGHAITDMDLGIEMNIREGSLHHAKLTDIKKGQEGTPGQLIGYINYRANAPEGYIYSNSTCGISGEMTKLPDALKNVSPVTLGDSDDIQKGPALLICDVSGQREAYNIEIEKIYGLFSTENKNFTIHVTDERLMELTGGIVQGLSGSPIIQDGKLVGAVTHVLVNDPTRGYGIFIENMLEH